MTWETDLLDGLTEAQRRASETLDGPVLVLAGPGSGKTTVVTRRVANLVANGIPPWQILALTFTNKAAREMRERIEQVVPADLPGRRGLTVTTFHSFGARQLRRYAPSSGLSPSYSIYDSGDQRDAMKRAIAKAGLSTTNWTPASVAAAISAAKNRLQNAEAFAQSAGDFYSRSIARVFTEYERILRDANAVDFDDLLCLTALVIRNDPTARTELQERYRYLLIDEYQDTNHAQFVIAHELAEAHRNICVVGDPDQSIYGWRGADLSNILDFETHYQEAVVIPLGQNFRSTGHIVATAAGLIDHNRHRKPKRLYTELGDGEKPQVVGARDEHGEARLISEELRRRFDDGIPWREMAVLYRINALSRVLEDALRRDGIPYVIARGTAFFERKEVKDALAYLRVIANPRDEVSMRRIINTPTRGIGRTTLQKVETEMARRGVTMLDAARDAGRIEGLGARAIASLEKFAALVDGWRRAAEQGRRAGGTELGLGGFVDDVVRHSGLEKAYRQSRLEEDAERAENLAELVSAAAEFVPVPIEADAVPDVDGAVVEDPQPLTLAGTLAAFLESITLVSDADAVDPARGTVTLMTLHTAKGLEFDVVAMAGLEEGLLPHARASTSEMELEEERRLCFVGITRARRHLQLSHALVRTHRGIRERTIPSQFLGQLPPGDVVVFDAPDLYEPTYEDDFGAGADVAVGDFKVGCLVRHPMFGVGRIESLTPRPRGSAARVAFQTGGVKTLILEYAKLERVEWSD